jgi:carboxyl-terminal processing protease
MLAPGAALGHHRGVDARDAARRPARRAGWLVALGLVALAVFARRGEPSGSGAEDQAEPARALDVRAPAALPAAPDTHALSLPTGAPPGIRCEEAKKVSAFLEAELAAPPIAPTPAELAEAWASLLDPHGLWSAAPDSPVRPELLAAASSLLASFSERRGDCEGAERVARVWLSAQERLLGIYDAAFAVAQRRARPRRDTEVFRLAAEPLFEDDPVTRPATELARELGERLAAFAARFPEESALVEQARARFFPTGAEQLRDMAILAALRAYVPLVDPHGDFAAADEEWSLYAGDDTLDAGSPLWGEIARTPLGARVTSDPAPPLELDDVVLAIDGLTLAGASVDQIEQAARSAPRGGSRTLRVLRQGAPQLLSLHPADEPPSAFEALRVERIRYGQGDQVVLRVVVPDVTDGLGEELSELLERESPGTSALLLDLRGNGGGSLDAAVKALGLFVPGAKLFPLIHRGVVTEVLEAERPARPYHGPVAALVDGDTASAAEMLAGALQAYGRGTLIGARTFGKGCVQEYFDDVVAGGVLRLTTLQFVMPDGRPLQQIGLTPELSLPLPPALERESELARQPITFSGPDVRSPAVAAGPAWPRDSQRASGCEDPTVCRAISRLASAKTSAAGRGAKPADSSLRAARPRAGTR